MQYNVVVIGGGASGLAAALTLSQNSKLKILLVDASDRLGKKLSATGNGQGNVSNLDMSISHYRSSNLPLVDRIIHDESLSYKSLFNLLFTSDERGRVYPAGRQASALTDSLIFSLSKTDVEVRLSTKVLKIEEGFKLTLSTGESVECQKVVFSVGGKAQKQFKTDGSSYALIENLGHSLTSLYPSLVQLKCDTTHIKTLKGIRTDCKVSKGDISFRGDVIFTDFGISGNAIFSISPYFAKSGGTISLEFLPDISLEEIEADIERKKSLGYKDSELLSGTLHNQLGRAIIRRTGTTDSKIIANIVKNFEVEVLGTLGFDYAQVTIGGVKMEEVGEDLQSKKVTNLYLTGEVLDVDGDCGGYNLHFAFASGKYAALNILKCYD